MESESLLNPLRFIMMLLFRPQRIPEIVLCMTCKKSPLGMRYNSKSFSTIGGMKVYFAIFLFCIFLPFHGYAQQKKIIHKARTSMVIPGLRREFDAELANLSIEANPGWQAEESIDSIEHIYQLAFTQPDDSTKILSLLMERYESKGFDSLRWNALRLSIRQSYGDRGIALRPLDEQITNAAMSDSTGIIARYELLAKFSDHLEYIDAVVGKSSLVLLTIPIKSDEYRKKIGYFRDISASIKLERTK
jgi:hypothetical protein